MNTDTQMQQVVSLKMERVGEWLERNRGYVSFAVAALFMTLCLVTPFPSYAQDIIGEKASTAVEWIKRGVYFILVIAVIGSGVLAAFGRMSWATVGQVLVGAIIAGLATEVVDALYDGG